MRERRERERERERRVPKRERERERLRETRNRRGVDIVATNVTAATMPKPRDIVMPGLAKKRVGTKETRETEREREERALEALHTDVPLSIAMRTCRYTPPMSCAT